MTARNLAETFHDLSDLARTRAGSIAALAYEDKGTCIFDPVTALDRDIEAHLRSYLLDRFPGHGIWGEEEGWSNPDAADHWSIDPIDGTRALICGLPSWCVLVGYLEQGTHVAGMIDCPALDERLIAIAGVTKRNGHVVRASRCEALAQARLSTTDPHLFAGEDATAFHAVRERVLLTRYGLDALGYARVATGDLDLVIESGLKRHDLDALVPVIRGAGGHVGDWDGETDWNGGRIVAAATRELYDEAVAALAR